MWKVFLNKQKRENVKETIEVVFAALTIISFASSKIKKHKAEKEESENTTENE